MINTYQGNKSREGAYSLKGNDNWQVKYLDSVYGGSTKNQKMFDEGNIVISIWQTGIRTEK